MRKITMADILELPVDERIELVQNIWDSLRDVPDAIELTDEQKQELDRRLEEHRRNPATAIPWAEVRSQFIK
jgi:putative addiction module component (TIGR02574 family)